MGDSCKDHHKLKASIQRASCNQTYCAPVDTLALPSLMLNSETSLTLSVPLRSYPLPGTCFYTAQLPPSAFQTSTKPRCLDGSNMVSYSMYLKPSIVPPNEPPKNPKTATARGSSLCLRLSAARLFCSAMGSPPHSHLNRALYVCISLWKSPRLNCTLAGRVKGSLAGSETGEPCASSKGVTAFLLLKEDTADSKSSCRAGLS